MQALAAVLGGAQSLHTNGKDEALGLPTEESARLGATHAADHRARNSGNQHRRPCWAAATDIEQLTDEIERGAQRIYRAHRRHGRNAGRHREGFHPERNPERRLRISAAVERGETVVVGVNRFSQDEKDPPITFRIDPELEKQQVIRLKQLRASRDNTLRANRVWKSWKQPHAEREI